VIRREISTDHDGSRRQIVVSVEPGSSAAHALRVQIGAHSLTVSQARAVAHALLECASEIDGERVHFGSAVQPSYNDTLRRIETIEKATVQFTDQLGTPIARLVDLGAKQDRRLAELERKFATKVDGAISQAVDLAVSKATDRSLASRVTTSEVQLRDTAQAATDAAKRSVAIARMMLKETCWADYAASWAKCGIATPPLAREQFEWLTDRRA
jgi:hypothetical protein